MSIGTFGNNHEKGGCQFTWLFPNPTWVSLGSAAMYSISPVCAMVWFWLYMVMFYLIMLNMLLAIVMDTYADVKAESLEKEEVSLFADASGFVKRFTLPFGFPQHSNILIQTDCHLFGFFPFGLTAQC